jgi:hypothetical protein
VSPLSGAGTTVKQLDACTREGLAFSGLAGILARPDADPFALLNGGIKQQLFNVARVQPDVHHIQEAITAALVADRFNANSPIGIVQLGLFSRRQVPIANVNSLADDPLIIAKRPGFQQLTTDRNKPGGPEH